MNSSRPFFKAERTPLTFQETSFMQESRRDRGIPMGNLDPDCNAGLHDGATHLVFAKSGWLIHAIPHHTTPPACPPSLLFPSDAGSRIACTPCRSACPRCGI